MVSERTRQLKTLKAEYARVRTENERLGIFVRHVARRLGAVRETWTELGVRQGRIRTVEDMVAGETRIRRFLVKNEGEQALAQQRPEAPAERGPTPSWTPTVAAEADERRGG